MLPSLLHRLRNPRLWAGWLALALLFAGTMGQLHHVAHAPGLDGLRPAKQGGPGPQVHAYGHGHGHAHEAHAHPHGRADSGAHGWLHALFGVHTDAECRLYDQLSGEPALPGLPLVLIPLQLPTAQLMGRAGEFIARWAALFDARGPPRAGVPFTF